jgi:hypothetical protein
MRNVDPILGLRNEPNEALGLREGIDHFERNYESPDSAFIGRARSQL